MTIIYITEDNCQSYAVTYRNNSQFRVQKKEDIGNDKKLYMKSILWKYFQVKANVV